MTLLQQVVAPSTNIILRYIVGPEKSTCRMAVVFENRCNMLGETEDVNNDYIYTERLNVP